MYQSDYEQRRPAVPPLHPMDPYKPSRPIPPSRSYEPIPYEPTPRPYEPAPYEPTPRPYEPAPREPAMPNMPPMDCPMMDPRFRDCVRVCMMMRCGDYPINTDYKNSDYIDLHKLSPYYNKETE